MRSVSLVFLSCGLALTACQTPDAGRSGGRAGMRSTETSSAEPQYDPAKAFLTLDKVLPQVEIPASTASQPAEIPAQAVRRIMKGKELYKENRFTEAILELEKALQYAPQSFEVNRLLAQVCRKAGNDGRAVSHLRKAVETKPDDIIVRYLLGIYAAQAGTVDEAFTQFALALKCPDATEDNAYRVLTHYRLAELCVSQGYLTAGALQYQEFFRLIALDQAGHAANPELVELIRLERGTIAGTLADIYQRLGRKKEAVEVLAKTIALLPEDFALKTRYARLLSRLGRHGEATHAAEEIMAARSGDPESVALLLEVHERAGTPDKALAILRGLIDQRPEDRALSLALFGALLDRGRDDDAEQVLSRFLVNSPNDVTVRWRLVNLYEQRQRWIDAVTEVSRIVEADPAHSTALEGFIDRMRKSPESFEAVLAGGGRTLAAHPNAFGLPHVIGLLAAAEGKYDLARQMQKRALEIRADFTPARIALAEAYLKEGAWEKVIELCKKAIESGGREAALHRILGQAYDALDDIENATTQYLEATRLDRQDGQAMLRLAKLYERTGQTNKAQRQYTNTLTVDPKMHQAREALIRIYLTGQVKFDLAKKQLDALAKFGGDTPDYARAREFYNLRERQFKERAPAGTATAIKHLTAYADGMKKIAEQFPENVGSLYVAGLSAYQIKRYEEALHWCQKALQLDPDHIPARELFVYVQRRLLKQSQAKDTIKVLLKKRPNRRSWKLLLAEQYLIEQDFTRAAGIYREILSDKSAGDRRDIYRRNLIDALQLGGQSQEAIRLLDTWIEEEKDKKRTSLYRELRILVQYWAGDTDQALEAVKQWYEHDADNMQVRLQLIQAALQDEQPLVALGYIRNWLTTDPENQTLGTLLIHVLVAAERFQDAIELTRNDAEIPDRGYRSRLNLAMVLGKAGQDDERVNVLRRVLQDRRSAGERVEEDVERVVYALLSAKRFKEAEQLLTMKIDEEKNNVEQKGTGPALQRAWLRLLSFCYQREKRVRLAANILEDILELYPKDTGICNDLGYTLADAGIDLDRAEKLIRIAVGEVPRSNAYLDSMGWLLYKKGDYSGAKTWLTRAVRARSMLGNNLDSVDDPVLYDHLGDALWRLGEKEAAVAAWEKSVALYEGLLRRHVDREDGNLFENTRKKIAAFQQGKVPPVAELGQKQAA